MSRAIEVEVMRHLFASIAEEMGAALGKSASSPNIRERRDYSCAIFDARGHTIAQAAHIPVHLGSAPLSVQAALSAFPRLAPDDHILLNDPYAGGTHLPDLTLVSPVFDSQGTLCFLVANRAHHADVGGISPGSLPLSTHIDQEGIRIPPTRWSEALGEQIMAASRTPEERRGDLMAQHAANHRGVARLQAEMSSRGAQALVAAGQMLCEHTARAMREFLESLPDGQWEAQDCLEDDGHGARDLWLRCVLTKRGGQITFDLRESDPQVAGPLNVPRAVSVSAALYVLRLIAPPEIPTNAGMMHVLDVLTEPGTLAEAVWPGAVAAGNVETSQRLVDVMLRAVGQGWPRFAVAASGGTMNNVVIGRGPDATGAGAFAYYETIATGSGAWALGPGASAIQTHMTNTLNTPVEVFEQAYPLRVTRYALRRDSGGRGEWPGGDGVVREVEALEPVHVTLMTERRIHRPWGLAGGEGGQPGQNVRLSASGEPEPLPGKCTFVLEIGERVRVETPGGGGWGRWRP